VAQELADRLGGRLTAAEDRDDLLEGHGPRAQALGCAPLDERRGRRQQLARTDHQVVGLVRGVAQRRGRRHRDARRQQALGCRHPVASQGLRFEAQAAPSARDPREPGDPARRLVRHVEHHGRTRDVRQLGDPGLEPGALEASLPQARRLRVLQAEAVEEHHRAHAGVADVRERDFVRSFAQQRGRQRRGQAVRPLAVEVGLTDLDPVDRHAQVVVLRRLDGVGRSLQVDHEPRAERRARVDARERERLHAHGAAGQAVPQPRVLCLEQPGLVEAVLLEAVARAAEPSGAPAGDDGRSIIATPPSARSSWCATSPENQVEPAA
jgi:hypothetical protein